MNRQIVTTQVLFEIKTTKSYFYKKSKNVIIYCVLKIVLTFAQKYFI